MKTRAYVMLGLAMLLAVASVFMARTWIQNQVQPVAQVDQKPQVETTKILVAASQLQYGNKVRREHLRLVDWPVSAVPEGAFNSFEEILGEETKDGAPQKDRVVLRSIEVNEPILLSDLQARTRRPVLRPHLRSDQGLRMLVRQVQANEIPRHHLREVRR